MSPKRIAALALSGALIAGGTGAAIAAVDARTSTSSAEQAILDDAAKRLDVTPAEAARRARCRAGRSSTSASTQAVKDGKLTQKQADEIKQADARSHGSVLGGKRFFGGPRRPQRRHELHFRGGPLKGMRGAIALNLSKALGISRAQLKEQLRDGKSVADIAKAQGKSLADVRTTLSRPTRRRAPTRPSRTATSRASQADKLLEHLDETIEHLDEAPGCGCTSASIPAGLRTSSQAASCRRPTRSRRSRPASSAEARLTASFRRAGP